MRIGMDLGGTTVTAGLVNEEGKILASRSAMTGANRGAQAIVDTMAELVRALKEACSEPICGVGVGTPGAVDVTGRIVITSPNLPFTHFPMADLLEDQVGLPVYLGNDANCALLGEQFAGAAKGLSDVVLVALGTGVGGGIMVDGKLLVGFNGAAGEIGHMTFLRGGLPCGCGRSGCYELYASTSALVREAKSAMMRDPESLLYQMTSGDPEQMNGRVIFEAAHRKDAAALSVLDAYEEDVALGAASLINIFEPEMLVFGGGISGQGEYLLSPIREKIYREIYCPEGLPRTKIAAATLGGDAGIVGAAALVRV